MNEKTNMRFILSLLLTAVLAFLAGIFLPWWSIALIAFLVALLIPQTLFAGFLSGFLGIFILWALLAFWIDMKNQGILSGRIAALLHLGDSSIPLILVTAVTGALVGGFAAMAGSSIRPWNRLR
jgi:hypothetical protein